jgi:acyl transferase domain-containing protein/NAD(P)H-dependent flavin oxidoreductase YrpB (nitropropane dioxygenase family)
MGVLDLEYADDEKRVLAALELLESRAGASFGIRVDSGSYDLAASLLDRFEGSASTVVLTGGDPQARSRLAGLLRESRVEVLLEVTSLAEAREGPELGVQGLIAKGNESGGWVGEETSFILLQRLLSNLDLPVLCHGGIGLHTAAAVYAAGAAGVVLDAQLALTRESPLPEEPRQRIRGMDGSETLCLGEELGAACRVFAQPNLPGLEALQEELESLESSSRPLEERRLEWRRAVARRGGWADDDRCVWLLGQDAAFAAQLAESFVTVGGVLGGVRRAVEEHARCAARLLPLREGAPLARSHGTRFPILQGPMTRVSDRAEFALQVAEGGGLPFLALALLRGPEVESLLEETRRLLGDRSWGVGILGFVPRELREEQLAVIRRFQPPFALIAGGRPDQARQLEEEGTPTYLHVPSPGLLRLFLQDGARRFVFEGRECGGHVGPRSSFVLWNTMLDLLADELPAGEESDCHIVFAGGIHDSRSAAMVATMSAPLAERGVNVGVLLGTSYLFTQEAVATGAITRGFQDQAVGCRQTVLVGSGPGHAIRCVVSPYVEEFRRERRRLLNEGRSAEEIREFLERMNLGRLRIASKGVTRHPGYKAGDGEAPKHVTVAEEEQIRQGMYMIGQLAALRDRTCTIRELHEEIAVEGSRRVEALAAAAEPITVSEPVKPAQIAIVGISTIVPRAADRRQYWQNILAKVNAIREIPKERWDWELYFDADPAAKDKIYSKWGGFIDEQPFDPTEFGMPPNSLRSIDPMQLLALKAARDALQDAGYWKRQFDRSRAAVILGASGGTGDLGAGYLLRSSLPLLFGEQAAKVVSAEEARLPEWTEDSFAGLLLNVAAGRIANRLDFGGVNYVVDAACASSLAATHLAVRELEGGSADLVLVGGVDTTQNPFGYLCFSKTHALSPTGQARTFDAGADGIAISEGVVMLVLKRLEDAERDGDRIYAVIQSVAGSSDGKAMGMTAPRAEGQVLALERAYGKVGFSPATVGLFEAHGTGTVVGDRTEALALSSYLEEAGAPPASAAIGSVKSMIGHTKATAGVASLAKVALALHHKILPPTLGVTEPNAKARFASGPLYVNTETRPWVHSDETHPRRAGVSSFGFGGTNFHAVVEEYSGGYLEPEAPAQDWPTELMLWRAGSRDELTGRLEAFARSLEEAEAPALSELARGLWKSDGQPASAGVPPCRLAIVASSLEDLREKVSRAQAAVAIETTEDLFDPRGVYFTDRAVTGDEKVAFLFPGQGSQYPNMARDLALYFPEVREGYERADRALETLFTGSLSDFVFPPPAFEPEEEKRQREALKQTQVAQPAIGATSLAMLALLRNLGLRPDMVAGHSYGEYVALCAASVIDADSLAVLSEARGRAIVEAAEADLGTMLAVEGAGDRVEAALDSVEEIWLANLNSPRQTVVSGTVPGIEKAQERLREQGLRARRVPVACAFHSPLVAPARERLEAVLKEHELATPRIPVFSNTTAGPYPGEPEAIARLLGQHLVRPVKFAEEIEAIYRAGGRLFVEVGPSSVLTSLVGQILDGSDHLAVSVDVAGRHGLTQLQHALARLAVRGVALSLERLFAGRAERPSVSAEPGFGQATLSPTTWMVSGGGARPVGEALRESRPTSLVVGSPAELAAAAPERPAVPVPSSTGRPAASSPDGVMPSDPRVPSREAGGQVGSGALGRDGAEVVLQFQQLMGRFLDTQRAVMGTYLQADSSQARRAAEGTVSMELPVAPEEQVQERPPVTLSEPSDSATPETAEPEISREIAADQPEDVATAGVVDLTAQLLQIVSERTGYPPEILDLDVDIEAELGIDSIKRVEILGNFQRETIPAGAQIGDESLEELAAIKTLRGIVEWTHQALTESETAAELPTTGESASTGAPADEASAARHEPAPSGAGEGEADIPRSVLTAVEAPAGDGGPILPANRVLLITDDESGIGEALAEGLREQGARVVLARHRTDPVASETGVYEADLGDATAVGELVASIRAAEGPIGGILHLLPLRQDGGVSPLELASWRQSARQDVKSLFHLARAVSAELREAGQNGNRQSAEAQSDGAWCLAATPLAEAYPDDPDKRAEFNPVLAGVAGLIKTLALEWPGVRCRVVSLAAADRDGWIAAIRRELGVANGAVEVFYRGSRRYALQPRLMMASSDGTAQLEMDESWVVLITGGGRGITSEVACELARRYQPRLLLVGRSPRPADEEGVATRGVEEPRELKAALMEQLREEGRPVTVPAVEAAYHRLLNQRELRRNLARMKSFGSAVEYIEADVRDEEAMAALVERCYETHSRLDGVIHGAGVIEDKLVEAKTPDSFDRVFDTKTDSACLLSGLLRPESLKFLALFSSASGPFGNRGQSDYSAANEVLNKLAIHLDRKWPGRVVSLNWGPWHKAGMVSPELQREFARRGVELIPIATGCRLFADEIRYGSKGEAEVILAGGAWAAAGSESVGQRAALPLLRRATVTTNGGKTIEVVRSLDPAQERYLRDHRIDEKPVLPVAMAMELMAEVVQEGWPDLTVAGLRELRVLKGIAVENGPKTIRVVGEVASEEPLEGDCLAVEVELRDENGSSHPNYRATVDLVARLPEPPSVDAGLIGDLQPFPLSVGEAYRRWLFHGPVFQSITEIEGVADRAMAAILNRSSPELCLAEGAEGSWLIDPVVFDSGLQLFLLWARANLDKTPLPSRFRRYRRFANGNGSEVHCQLRVLESSRDPVFHIDILFFDADGRLVGLLEDMEGACSKALNRLGAQSQP